MRRLLSLIALIVLTSTAIAADLTGKVVGVHDGDTLTLLVTGNQQVKVRLGEIDTPELDGNRDGTPCEKLCK